MNPEAIQLAGDIRTWLSEPHSPEDDLDEHLATICDRVLCDVKIRLIDRIAELSGEVERTRNQRDDWLWCYSLVVQILSRVPQWPTAKESYLFEGSEESVELLGSKLSKKLNRKLDRCIDCLAAIIAHEGFDQNGCALDATEWVTILKQMATECLNQ